MKETMKKYWDKVQPYVCSCTFLFSAIYLAAWVANGYAGMHFSCSDLMLWYSTVLVGRLGTHAINSVYNSPRGEDPDGKK